MKASGYFYRTVRDLPVPVAPQCHSPSSSSTATCSFFMIWKSRTDCSVCLNFSIGMSPSSTALSTPYSRIILLRVAVSPLTFLAAGETPCSRGPSRRVSSFPQYVHAAIAFLADSTWEPLSFFVMDMMETGPDREIIHWKWGVPASPFSSWQRAALTLRIDLRRVMNSSRVIVGLLWVPMKFLDFILEQWNFVSVIIDYKRSSILRPYIWFRDQKWVMKKSYLGWITDFRKIS